MTLSVRRQHLAIAKNEALWSTLARKEAASNHAQAVRFKKMGKNILAANYAREALWDIQWANKRTRIAVSERKKGLKKR